ncbi:PIG-L deacetylase family protein [Nocardia sp. NPDC004068]|uniref:PIG-L deacetylase family protein n=1 Tax=Nocardia sp. NPDC004068 TaxID=3364303 RepID=UPI0036951D98
MATVVAFHAHPDDEILLTGGLLAKLADEGHRTVIAVATDGHVDPFDGEIAPRLRELRASAEVLGVARVAHLGYADSGHGAELYPDPPGRIRFVRAEIEEAAERLAAILREERPDLLLSYDRNGGYGHRDHVRVQEVGSRAARLADVPRVLDATFPRELLRRYAAPFRWLGRDTTILDDWFLSRAETTHRVDVKAYAPQRLRALTEHRSVLVGDSRFATIGRTLLRLPRPLRNHLFRWEWYAEEGVGTRVPTPLDDIFTSAVRSATS